jgi:hypothetical protein
MEREAKMFCDSRIYNAHLASGERYYLQILLNTVKGCMPFEDIRTINGIVYPTFKDACQILGYLDDDSEWIHCVNEAANWADGTQLRQLFTTILCHCEVTSPKVFWESTCEALSEDIQYKRRKMFNFQIFQLTDAQIKAYALVEIEKLMKQVGRSMKDFPEIEMPSLHVLQEIGNMFMNEELNYDHKK